MRERGHGAPFCPEATPSVPSAVKGAPWPHHADRTKAREHYPPARSATAPRGGSPTLHPFKPRSIAATFGAASRESGRGAAAYRSPPPWLSNARCATRRSGRSALRVDLPRAPLRTSGNAPRVGCIRQSQPWRIHPTRSAINPAPLPRHPSPHRGRVVGARFAPP